MVEIDSPQSELDRISARYMLANNIAVLVQKEGSISFSELVRKVREIRDRPLSGLRFTDVDIGYGIAMAEHHYKTIKRRPWSAKLDEELIYIPGKKVKHWSIDESKMQEQKHEREYIQKNEKEK